MSVPRIKMIYIILSRVGHTPSSIQLEAPNSPRAAELRLLLYIKRFLFQISSVLEGGQMWGVGSRVQLSSPKGFSWSSVLTPPGSASSCRTECSHKRKSPTSRLVSMSTVRLTTRFQTHLHWRRATQTDLLHFCPGGQCSAAELGAGGPAGRWTRPRLFNEFQIRARSQLIMWPCSSAIPHQDYPNPDVQDRFAQTPPKPQDIPEGKPF